MFGDAILQPPNGGLDPSPRKCLVTVQEANRTIGELVALDLSQADAAVDNLSYGASDSGLSNVRTVDTADLAYGTLGIMIEDVTDGQQGEMVYRGRVRAKVVKASGNIAVGDPLYVGTSGALTADAPASGSKIVGRAAEAVTGPSTATLAWVLFEGVYPLGTVA